MLTIQYATVLHTVLSTLLQCSGADIVLLRKCSLIADHSADSIFHTSLFVFCLGLLGAFVFVVVFVCLPHLFVCLLHSFVRFICYCIFLLLTQAIYYPSSFDSPVIIAGSIHWTEVEKSWQDQLHQTTHLCFAILCTSLTLDQAHLLCVSSAT